MCESTNMLSNFLRKIAEQIDDKTIQNEDKEIVENFFLNWYCKKLENMIEKENLQLTYEDMMRYFTVSWFIFDSLNQQS